MDVETADSFSASSNSQLIEKRYSFTSIVWKIARVKSRFIDPGDKILSPLFRCSDASWQLTYFPEGEIELGRGSFRLSCHALTPWFNYFTFINISVIDDSGNNFCELGDSKYCFSSRCRNESVLLNFVQLDGLCFVDTSMLTINFSICVEEEGNSVISSLKQETNVSKDENTKLSSPSYISNSLSSDLEELYKNHQFSDVTLKLDGEEFEAHKSVLSARSRVFAAMFDHDMKESRQDTVDLAQMEVETVRDMLRYVYCGKIRDLSPEEALNLYVAADRYDLVELRTFCREAIILDISVENVCDIAEVAFLHDDDELLIRELKTFLFKNGKEVIKTEKWKAICTDQPILCGKMFEWAFSE